MSIQTSTSNPVAENVLPQQPVQDFNFNENYIRVYASNFGYLDSQDGGVGKWMDNTNNSNIVGVSLPISTTNSIFGKSAKHKLVEVHNPASQRTIIAPLVDVGPATNVKYGIDLTYNCYILLGGKPTLKNNKIVGGEGLYEVFYRPLSQNEQLQFEYLSSGYLGAGHTLDSPLRSLNNFIDLTQGTNAQRDQAIAQLANGNVPDYSQIVQNSTSNPSNESAAESNIIHTTTNLSPTPINTTAMPTGMFSLPEVGAKLWVFFRNGDPHFPVYFAASYSQAEWAAAYSSASPPLYYPGTDPKKLSKSDAAYMVPNKGGGLQCIEHVGEGGNMRSMKLFGYSGAHLEFSEDHNIYYSPHDDYHQADGHKFDVVQSNRETFTRGDSNKVTLGDHFVKVGNMSQSALQAMDRINEIIDNVNNIMLGDASSAPSVDTNAPVTPNELASKLASSTSNNQLLQQYNSATSDSTAKAQSPSTNTSAASFKNATGTTTITGTTKEVDNPLTKTVSVTNTSTNKTTVFGDASTPSSEALAANATPLSTQITQSVDKGLSKRELSPTEIQQQSVQNNKNKIIMIESKIKNYNTMPAQQQSWLDSNAKSLGFNNYIEYLNKSV